MDLWVRESGKFFLNVFLFQRNLINVSVFFSFISNDDDEEDEEDNDDEQDLGNYNILLRFLRKYNL